MKMVELMFPQIPNHQHYYGHAHKVVGTVVMIWMRGLLTKYLVFTSEIWNGNPNSLSLMIVELKYLVHRVSHHKSPNSMILVIFWCHQQSIPGISGTPSSPEPCKATTQRAYIHFSTKQKQAQSWDISLH